jgi:hypothetical protein
MLETVFQEIVRSVVRRGGGLSKLLILSFWRREGDSNPRYRFKPVQRFSNGVKLTPCCSDSTFCGIIHGSKSGENPQFGRNSATRMQLEEKFLVL